MQGIDEQKVEAWITANITSLRAPFRYELIAGGRSNLTFKGTDADGTLFVLRRPPLGNVLESAHNMEREHTIISAIGPTPVPVAETLGVCGDPDVNGAPFYVMSFVDGIILDGFDVAETLSDDTKRNLTHSLVDVLAELHAQDIDAIGLGDLARRTGYVERQLKRWTRQWEASKTREIPVIEEVQRRLHEAIPTQQRDVVAHGDYRFGNCLVDVDTASITGVLDWELCTLGDPMADLGYLGVWWADNAKPHPSTDPTWSGGWPAYTDVVERYANATGLDVSGIGYYVAFSTWRLAVIGEGVYARYAAGAMGDQDVDLSIMEDNSRHTGENALWALDNY